MKRQNKKGFKQERNALLISKYTKPILLAVITILLVGCGKKEEPFDWDSVTQESQEEILPVGYEDMKIKRGQHNSEKYSSAQHQQFATIDQPFLDSVIEDIMKVEEEFIDGLLDYKERMKIQRDNTYDNSSEILNIVKMYQELKVDITDYIETHPDAPKHVKNVYTDVTYEMIDVINSREVQLQTLADQVVAKLSGDFKQRDIYKTLLNIEAVRNKSKTLRGNYKLMVDLVNDYYNREFEEQQANNDLGADLLESESSDW